MTEKFEVLLKAICDFAVQLEDAGRRLRQAVAEVVGVEAPSKVAAASSKEAPQKPWDPDRIRWAEAVSAAGRPYQRYPPESGKIESTADYHGLLSELKRRGGKMEFNGYFYWLFKDGATIGRRRSQ